MAHVGNRRSFREVAHLPAYHELLPAISHAITNLCDQGDRKFRPTSGSVFECASAAPTSAHDYLVRLTKYGACGKWSFVVMAVLLNRWRHSCRTELNSFNVHRLMLTAFVVAVKTRDDVYYANKYYASVGGVRTTDLNTMERQLLLDLDWNLHVGTEELDSVVHALKSGFLDVAPSPPPVQQQVAAHQHEPVANRMGVAIKTAAPAPERAPDLDDQGVGNFVS
eukprot:Hpha_TRINITY_DN14707_c0_g1::TRINITY_DN14707_c0_g1_i1::g.102854::m.102854